MDDKLLKSMRDMSVYDGLRLSCASNAEFRPPIENVFEQQHGADLFFASNLKKESFCAEQQAQSIEFLNIFGNTLTKLSIQFKLDNVGILLNAVANNCGDKIIALKIHDFTDDEKLIQQLDGGLEIGQFVQNLGRQFPNLRYLTFEYRKEKQSCVYWNNIAHAIPSLERLTIHGRFDLQVLQNFILINPQLKSLGLHVDEVCCCGSEHHKQKGVFNKLPANFIEWVNNALPSLEHLFVNVTCIERSSNGLEQAVVNFDNLKTFVCEGLGGHGWTPNVQLITCEGLERLQFSYSFQGPEMDSIVEKLGHFPNLKELTVVAISKIKFAVALTWSPSSLRDLILSKDQLNKITIRKRAKDKEGYFYAPDSERIGDQYWQNTYHSLLDGELNGSRWKVRGNAHTIELSKVNAA